MSLTKLVYVRITGWINYLFIYCKDVVLKQLVIVIVHSFQETHRLYKQKLEEVSKLQDSCSGSIARQKKRLKELSDSLEGWVMVLCTSWTSCKVMADVFILL